MQVGGVALTPANGYVRRRTATRTATVLLTDVGCLLPVMRGGYAPLAARRLSD